MLILYHEFLVHSLAFADTKQCIQGKYFVKAIIDYLFRGYQNAKEEGVCLMFL